MAEISFPQFGGPADTRLRIAEYVDAHVPESYPVEGDRIAVNSFDFTQHSEIAGLLPVNTLFIQRFAAVTEGIPSEHATPNDRRVINAKYSGRMMLGIIHTPNPDCDLSPEAIENELVVYVNARSTPPLVKANYARHVIWRLMRDEQRGGIIPSRERSRGPRVAIQSAFD